MSELREEKRRIKREAIVSAALKLFAERGFHGTAVPLIAEAAGVGAGTIYRHFPSKEALVNALFKERRSAMLSALFDAFPWASPPEDRFRCFWRRLLRHARDESESVVFLELHHHAPYLDPENQALEARLELPILAFLEDERARGRVRDLDPPILIAMLRGLVIGLLKSARRGLIELDDTLIEASGQAAWQLIQGPEDPKPPPPDRKDRP